MDKFKNILDNIWGIGWILGLLTMLPVAIYAEITKTDKIEVIYNNGDWSVSCPFIIALLTCMYVIAYVTGGIAVLTRLSIWIYEQINKVIKK